MSQVMYMVIATLPSEAVAREFVEWLHAGHVRQVVECGAISGVVIRLDSDHSTPRRVMIQYLFPSRLVLDAYIRDRAPALRADGLKRFPPERGVSFSRDIGELSTR